MKKPLIFIWLLFIITGISHADDYFELRGGLRNSRTVFNTTKKGRVVFLGGSITHMQGWKELVAEDLKKRFPETEFDFINAGIPSTGSTPASFRFERDVLKNGKVDLLFEEAAVNDSVNFRTDTEQVRGMEGVIRHARKTNPEIDIIMMHFVDPRKMMKYNSGKTPKVIQNHESVAEHYNIPSINLAREVTDRINNKEFTWKDDFKNLHPAPFGHRLYASTISRLLDAAWKEPAPLTTEPYKLPVKLDNFCYDSGKLVPPADIKELKGFKVDPSWKNSVGGGTRPGFVDVPMLVSEKPGDSFEYTFKGSAVGLFAAAGPDAGIIEYRIDEGTWKKQDLYTPWSGQLHLPWVYMLENELKTDKPHRLEVRLTDQKNDKSKGTACRIVYVVVNGE